MKTQTEKQTAINDRFLFFYDTHVHMRLCGTRLKPLTRNGNSKQFRRALLVLSFYDLKNDGSHNRAFHKNLDLPPNVGKPVDHVEK